MSEMDRNAVYDPADTADSPEPGTLDIEAPEADAVEQHTQVRENDDRPPAGIPYDADEADAAEQHRAVELDDEDDYR